MIHAGRRRYCLGSRHRQEIGEHGLIVGSREGFELCDHINEVNIDVFSRRRA